MLTVVGRDQGCDVRLDSSRVSRRHCCLALDGDEVLVRDLGSTNGVSINGLRVEVGVLRQGDLLGIAHLRFRLVPRPPDGPGAPTETPRGPDSLPDTSLHETRRELMHPGAGTAGERGPRPGTMRG